MDPEYLKKLAVKTSFVFSFLRPPKQPELPSKKEEEEKETHKVLYCCDITLQYDQFEYTAFQTAPILHLNWRVAFSEVVK